MKTIISVIWHSQFMRWLLKTINWEMLSKLGRSRFVRSFFIWLILVPLFAKVFSNLPPEIEVNLLEKKFDLVLQFPFKLSVFYFTSFAFFLSSLIYNFSCPPLIKNYNSVSDFLSNNGSISYLRKYVNSFDSIQISEYNKRYPETMVPTTNDIANLYSELIDDLKLKSSIIRLLLLIIYIVGFSGLVSIFVDNTLVVLEQSKTVLEESK